MKHEPIDQIDPVAVERCFNSLNQAIAGERAINGYAAISTLIAGLVSCAAPDKRTARQLIEAITDDAKSQMKRDFDFFRSNARPIGPLTRA